MTPGSVDIWHETRRLRLEIADDLVGLSPEDWDMPSWCAGWRVRDVLGNLVNTAEATVLSMSWLILRNGFRPDRAVDRSARALGDDPLPALAERLRSAAGRRLHLPGVPPELPLADLVVHRADAMRPAGHDPETLPAVVLLALNIYEKWGCRLVHAVPHRDVSLAATDADWYAGSGPVVKGKTIDLLLLMANRKQVLKHLEGPGVNQLDF